MDSPNNNLTAYLMDMEEGALKKLAAEYGFPWLEGTTKQEFVGLMVKGDCPGCGNKISGDKTPWTAATGNADNVVVKKKFNQVTRRIERKLILK